MAIVSLFLTALSTLCASLPMLVFLAAIWWMDRYDREPIWLVALTFLWGAIGSILFALIGSLFVTRAIAIVAGIIAAFSPFDPLPWIDAAGAVVVAPLVEEPSKAVFLLFVIWNRHFDNMTDGFVYGAAAGLGFGMTENFMYFTSVTGDIEAWGFTVIIRTFYSAVMHATCTSIVGAALGFARFRGLPLLIVCGGTGLAMAMGVHALWNGLLTLADIDFAVAESVNFFYLNLVIFPFQVLVVFLLFQICLLEESANIRRELREEADNGVIPEHHPPVIASWIRRHTRSWLPKGVNHYRYIQTATSLAMRKKQIRQMRHRAPTFYLDDVKRLRRQLQVMLEGST
ncbi:MAG: PrsW family intramembrane metalloprotease [Proteobacteria bacterium]|mgnify:CR=1 FL=1|jgi:protease PrsW|nr:PrsW family intramembrane metalloprotease [Pseudomonadota bacterium]